MFTRLHTRSFNNTIYCYYTYCSHLKYVFHLARILAFSRRRNRRRPNLTKNKMSIRLETTTTTTTTRTRLRGRDIRAIFHHHHHHHHHLFSFLIAHYSSFCCHSYMSLMPGLSFFFAFRHPSHHGAEHVARAESHRRTARETKRSD